MGRQRFLSLVLGGTGYVNHLDVVSDILNRQGVEIVDIDDSHPTIDLNFENIKEDYWGNKHICVVIHSRRIIRLRD